MLLTHEYTFNPCSDPWSKVVDKGGKMTLLSNQNGFKVTK